MILHRKAIGVCIFSFTILLSLISCKSNKSSVLETVGTTNKEKSIRLLLPENQSDNVQITNNLILSFISEPYTHNCCDKYFDLESDKFAPSEIRFKWESDSSSQNSCELLISEYSDFSKTEVYATSNFELNISGLKGGTTYYWKVRNNIEESETFCFTTAASPRTVNIDGVSNTRDMGGWKTLDGAVLKQGIVYRTATLDKITEEGIDYCVNVLGIKTELDLRKSDEGNSGESMLGPSVNYIQISGPYYVGEGSIYSEENFEVTRKILEVFADKDNYPILFHCTVGRDRTGTIAFLLEALCNMSKDNIYREYDLSLFSANGDHAPSVMHKNFFTPMFRKLEVYGDGTLSENARQYMLDIGLTEAQINAIKNNLLLY